MYFSLWEERALPYWLPLHTWILSKVPLFAPPPPKHGSILSAHSARRKARSVPHNGHANSNELQAAFQKLTESVAHTPPPTATLVQRGQGRHPQTYSCTLVLPAGSQEGDHLPLKIVRKVLAGRTLEMGVAGQGWRRYTPDCPGCLGLPLISPILQTQTHRGTAKPRPGSRPGDAVRSACASCGKDSGPQPRQTNVASKGVIHDLKGHRERGKSAPKCVREAPT